MVVGEVPGDDRELEPGVAVGGVGNAADCVGVHIADGLVEGLWPERLVRAPEAEQRARRAQELEPGGRHLVGQLGVAQLGEEGDGAAALCPVAGEPELEASDAARVAAGWVGAGATQAPRFDGDGWEVDVARRDGSLVEVTVGKRGELLGFDEERPGRRPGPG